MSACKHAGCNARFSTKVERENHDGSAALPWAVELALEMSRHVHNRCENVPHDIGLTLLEIVQRSLPPNSDSAI